MRILLFLLFTKHYYDQTEEQGMVSKIYAVIICL
jgi:hypothetical protein